MMKLFEVIDTKEKRVYVVLSNTREDAIKIAKKEHLSPLKKYIVEELDASSPHVVSSFEYDFVWP